MENTFIRLSTELLKNKELCPYKKIILSYFLSYQANDQACYQTENEISEALGIKLRTLKKHIKELIELNYCYKEKASKFSGKRQYKNRKAILVGEQPKEDVKTVLKEDNVSNDSITPIKPVEVKIEATKSIENNINKNKEDMNKQELKDTLSIIKKNKLNNKQTTDSKKEESYYSVDYVTKYIKNIVSLHPSLKGIEETVINIGLIQYNNTKVLPTITTITNELKELQK